MVASNYILYNYIITFHGITSRRFNSFSPSIYVVNKYIERMRRFNSFSVSIYVVLERDRSLTSSKIINHHRKTEYVFGS